MTADVLSQLIPVFTMIIGYVGKELSDRIQHNRSLERDRKTKAADRRLQLLDRRAAFQRSTLLELQDTLFALLRSTELIHQHDLAAARQGKQWHRTPVPQELTEQDRQNHAKASLLLSRVSDSEIRKSAGTVKTLCTEILLAEDAEIAEDRQLQSSAAFGVLNERIGQELRRIEDAELAELEDRTGLR